MTLGFFKEGYLFICSVNTRNMHILSPSSSIYSIPPNLFSTLFSHTLCLGCWPSWTASTSSLDLWLLIEFSQWDTLVEIRGYKECFPWPNPFWALADWLPFWDIASDREAFLPQFYFWAQERALSFCAFNIPLVLVLVYCSTPCCFG